MIIKNEIDRNEAIEKLKKAKLPVLFDSYELDSFGLRMAEQDLLSIGLYKIGAEEIFMDLAKSILDEK